MANPVLDSLAPGGQYAIPANEQIWSHLRQAIASSSGFQRWRLERQIEKQDTDLTLEQQVSYYLRETLETLAY
jgi:hypothetical protein